MAAASATHAAGHAPPRRFFGFPRGASTPGLSLPFYSVWRAVTHLLVLVAFLSLFATGELDGPINIAFLGTWAVAFVMRRSPSWWASWMGSFVTLAVIAFLAILAKNAFFTSVLYLLLYLALAKCFTLRTPQDYLQAQILCFFMILSTAVITVSFHFILFFVLYLFLATMGLILFGVALQSERLRPKKIPRDQARALQIAGSLPGRFLAGAWATPILILALIIILFLLIPHVSYRQLNAPLSSRSTPQETLTGFSEDVTLGSFKRLQPDPTVVMRIEVNWPPGAENLRPPYLRVRGVALDYYDKRRWRRAMRPDKSAQMIQTQQINPQIPSAQKGRITYETVYQSAQITSRLFAGSLPMEIDLGRPLRVRFDQETGSAQVVAFGGGRENSFTDPFVYKVTSSLVDEATPVLMDFIEKERARRTEVAGYLQKVNDRKWAREFSKKMQTPNSGGSKSNLLPFPNRFTLDAEERVINTQLPQVELIDRIRKLTEKVAPGPTPAEIMFQLVKHLRGDYRYTLEQDLAPDEDPIESFLFKTKKGHCEYFATSLVLMLRSRGIPARIVNGFYTTEWNELANVFVVKQSDAHAWVEAWSDELGWLTLDPTPPGSAGSGAYGFHNMSILSAISEFMRIQWQRYVIDYSRPRQAAFLERIRGRLGVEKVLSALALTPDRFLGRNAKRTLAKPDDKPKRDIFDWIFQIALISLLILAVVQIYRSIRRRIMQKKFRSPIDYLNLLLHKLESLGWKRPPGQTPLEFISGLQAAGPQAADLAWLIGLYYRQRFSYESPEAEERRRAMELIRSLQIPRNPNRS